MAKVKKMADGGITGLGSLLAGAIDPGSGGGAGVGGGGTAQDGLGEINAGTATVGKAIGTAQSALGGGGGGGAGVSGSGGAGVSGGGGGGAGVSGGCGNSILGAVGNGMVGIPQKKGGAVKKHLRVNQDNSKISTHKKNPKHKNSW